MEILLLVAAIVTFASWLAGLITISTGKAADFQAHSAKFTRSLSIVYLGREALKKHPVFSRAQLLRACDLLLQMVIETQAEKGVYG